MVSDRLVQVLRHIERRGIELDNRAVALVAAHYRQLDLDGLTDLLDQVATIDSRARRVGYVQAILDQFDQLAGLLGDLPAGLGDLLRDATRLGMAATAELVDAQTGLAFDLPARRELQYLRRSQERFQGFWNKEPLRFRQDVQDVLTTGLERGQRPADIMTALQARQKVSRSRAALIVRNETGNAQGYAMQTDQRAMGFTRYIWSTARDRRVRPLHRAREGKVYEWTNPPGDGAPGEAIMCRCCAIPTPT